MAQLSTYLIFHLNLAYSSISTTERTEVIKRCYWPLLRMVERQRFPVAIEASGYTLETIASYDPEWIQLLTEMTGAGRCELIGSGYAQIIGPLVPARLNTENQRLGIESYRRLLGTTPTIAWVNEQAYSAGLVGHYLDAGYQALVVEWDNPARFHPDWPREWRYLPQRVEGADGRTMPLIWNSSIAFQRFQHYAHGDISEDEYLDFIRRQIGDTPRTLALYGSDIEVIGYRPGRYRNEAPLGLEDEWLCVENLLVTLGRKPEINVLPLSSLFALLNLPGAGNRLRLESAQDPIPVKKQPKYNLCRWAVSGRGDLRLNTLCHRIAGALFDHAAFASDDDYLRRLCNLWASDLRTHITNERWDQAQSELQQLTADLAVNLDFEASQPVLGRESRAQTVSGCSHLPVEILRMDNKLRLKTDRIDLCLNLRRGLAIESLAFRRHGFNATVGTIPHGYYDIIDLGADFYTGHSVVELITEHTRITDLNRVEPVFSGDAEQLTLIARVETDIGVIRKQICLKRDRESITLKVAFPGWLRPRGSVRIGHVTLLPEAFDQPLTLTCSNGGYSLEHFDLIETVQQSHPPSTLISCSSGLGATTGVIEIGDATRRIRLNWDPERCAVFPMLLHRQAQPAPLTRIIFSLNELDETFAEGGELPEFEFTITAA